MSEALSPSAGRPYGLARVCRWWEVARSTVYAARGRRQRTALPSKRGPRTQYSDAELLARIRQVLATSEWVGEGHRKAWAQLRAAGVRTSKPRVLRLMREANLLAPTRTGAPRGPRAHDGKITTERPDEMWGTDGTTTMTGEGQATIFVVVDHCTSECLGLHATARGNRFEALEPVHQAVTEVFGGVDEKIAAGVQLRHDHGSVYTSEVFSARSASSASSRARPSCALPRGMAAPSASSARSRSSCSGCASFRPSPSSTLRSPTSACATTSAGDSSGMTIGPQPRSVPPSWHSRPQLEYTHETVREIAGATTSPSPAAGSRSRALPGAVHRPTRGIPRG